MTEQTTVTVGKPVAGERERPFASTGEPSGYCDHVEPDATEACDATPPAYTIRWADGEFSQSCSEHISVVDRRAVSWIRKAADAQF